HVPTPRGQLWGVLRTAVRAHVRTPSGQLWLRPADAMIGLMSGTVRLAILVPFAFYMTRHVVAIGAALGLLVVLWPSHAWAWGPLAHLEFSGGALESLDLLSPAMRLLLSNFSSEFLYGSLAADIIVGKNLAR